MTQRTLLRRNGSRKSRRALGLPLPLAFGLTASLAAVLQVGDAHAQLLAAPAQDPLAIDPATDPLLTRLPDRLPDAAGPECRNSDPSGDALTAQLVNGPAHGTMALNANGSFYYRATPDCNGTATSNPVTVSPSGQGNDRLDGGTTNDTLTGGAGDDRFVFTLVADFGTGASDAIIDFSHAELDRIDLSTIDAVAGDAPNQAFAFIGTGAFTGTAGQLRYEIVDGNGAADFSFTVNSATPLVASDFVL